MFKDRAAVRSPGNEGQHEVLNGAVRRLMACGALVLIAGVITPAAPAAASPSTLGFQVSPGSGPPGTSVHFAGNVPAGINGFDNYFLPGFAYGLQGAGPNGCELILPMLDITKNATGGTHLTGSFVVGAEGGCFMSPTNLGPQPAAPGVYLILLSCHACAPIGTFTVTSAAMPLTGGASVPLADAGLGLLGIGLSLLAVSRRFQRSGSDRQRPMMGP
jgi:hypothetical protein